MYGCMYRFEKIRKIWQYLFKMGMKLRKQITLSSESMKLMLENEIKNVSAYIDCLILRDLAKNDYKFRKLVSKMNRIQAEFKEFGKEMRIEFVDINKNQQNQT